MQYKNIDLLNKKLKNLIINNELIIKMEIKQKQKTK